MERHGADAERQADTAKKTVETLFESYPAGRSDGAALKVSCTSDMEDSIRGRVKAIRRKLAAFCQVLAAEKPGDELEGYPKERADQNLRWLNAQVARNERLKGIPMAEYGNKNMTGFSYTRGAILFSILYCWLGEETFNNLVGGFRRHYYESGASTETFTDYRVRRGKNKRLKIFFDDWPYTTGYTKYLRLDTTIEDIVAVYKK